jgi:hypothetical protein
VRTVDSKGADEPQPGPRLADGKRYVWEGNRFPRLSTPAPLGCQVIDVYGCADRTWKWNPKKRYEALRFDIQAVLGAGHVNSG